MSNHLAVATVTRALGALIQRSLEGVENVNVKYERPASGEQGSSAVNIYLYQVMADAARLNELLLPVMFKGN